MHCDFWIPNEMTWRFRQTVIWTIHALVLILMITGNLLFHTCNCMLSWNSNYSCWFVIQSSWNYPISLEGEFHHPNSPCFNVSILDKCIPCKLKKLMHDHREEVFYQQTHTSISRDYFYTPRVYSQAAFLLSLGAADQIYQTRHEPGMILIIHMGV